jgi:hypothetical protein
VDIQTFCPAQNLVSLDRKVARNPLLLLHSTVTSKPKKKDNDMKIDKTTYKDRKERLNGMTADHTRRPHKVLFFADPHFLFLSPCTQMAHCLLPDTQVSQRFAKVKEPFLPSHEKSKFTNTNFKIK